MKSTALLFAATLAALPAAVADNPPASRVFRAGAAIGDITPELGLPIVGNWDSPPAKHIHDPLHVRVLVLDDGAQRLALVVCDNLMLPREVCDEAKRLTQELTGLDRAHVLISATHTHSGASADPSRAARDTAGQAKPAPGATWPTEAGATTPIARYQQLIVRRIADTVQCAINRLEPARIGWGSGHEPNQVFNRRWFVSDEKDRRNPFGGVDEVRMNPPRGAASLVKPAGPTDPEIPFVSVQAKNGRPIALLAAYSLHYVGGVPSGVVSADYFGVFAVRIAELLGADRQDPPFVGILANGTSGNINNINFRDKSPPARAPFEQMRRVANTVAAEVYRACQTVEYRDWVPLDARHEDLTLATRRPTEAMLQRARALLAQPANTPRWQPQELVYANRLIHRAAAPASVSVPVQVVRIGDVGIMTVPAETFVETGLELKARAPFGKPFAVSHANGAFGYLPTAEQHRLGGYETWLGTNYLEVDAAAKITATLLRLAGEIGSK
jgi:hypothetical protein